MNLVLGLLALLSLVLAVWQWLAGRRFPLHTRTATPDFAPAVTLLKPLKGCDANTADCLRSWLTQAYAGKRQYLFGISDPADPAGEIVRALLQEFPQADAQLVVCGESLGTNAKVSTLIQLMRRAKHEAIVISDADVRVPPDALANLLAPLRDDNVGLVNCFYRLANPANSAMCMEAVAINADFWSQVLQARSLAPLDFALGAAMATRQKNLAAIGGFAAIADCLADDYQLGHRIAKLGRRIELCPVVVECWDKPMGWTAVWRHQLRWARTVRVSKPLGYFFSILSNPTLWPLLWVAARPNHFSVPFLMLALAVRAAMAIDLQAILNGHRRADASWWVAPGKDIFQAAIWVAAFGGNHIEWRGQKFLLKSDGTMVKT